MTIVIRNATLERQADDEWHFYSPDDGRIRVYGEIPGIDYGQLLLYDLTLTPRPAPGEYNFVSCVRRAMPHGAGLFAALVPLLKIHMPAVDQGAFLAIVQGYDRAPDKDAYFATHILPRMRAWAQLQAVLIWLEWSSYDKMWRYYADEAVFEATQAEVREICRIIDGVDDDEAAFLKLALCGSGEPTWVTGTMPIQDGPCDAPRYSDRLWKAIDDAAPWFADQTHAEAEANADVIASGFLHLHDGLYYRASYFAARAAVASYPFLKPYPPFPTVTAMAAALDRLKNDSRDREIVPVIVRKAGCIHDVRSADRGSAPPTWMFTDAEFYGHDCDMDVAQIIVYMVDQWTFCDLAALIAHVAPRTPRLSLLGTGRFNNRAGYNVLPKLCADFTLADVDVGARAIPLADLAGAFNLKTRHNYTLTAPRIETNTIAWLHSPVRCYRSRWVFVCEEPALVHTLETILVYLHGPERGPPVLSGGPQHAVVPMAVRGGAADGVVGVLTKVRDTIPSRPGKRPRRLTVNPHIPRAAGVVREAVFGTPTNADPKIAPVTLGGGVTLVPKRIFTLDECAGLNGCSFIYVSSAPASPSVWQSLISVRGARIVALLVTPEQ